LEQMKAMIRLYIRQLQNLEPGSGKAETHWFTVVQKAD